MKKLPKGFELMDLEIILDKNKIKKFENKLLHLLIRDYNVLYTKEIEKKGSYDLIHFYCRPKDAVNISYRIGYYMKALSDDNMEFFSKTKNGNHVVPENFPKCIHIPQKELRKQLPYYK